MKKLFVFIAVLFAALSCTDLSGIQEQLDDHENRIAKLELLCSQMNENITSMQTVLQALEKNDYVTGVAVIEGEDGKEIGYKITFSKGETVKIYHGKSGAAPDLGVKKDTDGVYYWTLDGEFIVADGHKLRVEGLDGADGADGQPGAPGEDGQPGQPGRDGVTPKLEIREGYWYISYNDGESWSQLGKATGENGAAGDSFFKDVKVGINDLTLTLSSGEVIRLPMEKVASLSIVFEDKEIGILPSGSGIFKYQISGCEEPLITTMTSQGWKAEVKAESAVAGAIEVSAPATITGGEVFVLVSDGVSRTIMTKINPVSGVLTASVDHVDLPFEAGSFDISLNTNLQYNIEIAAGGEAWLSFDATKAMRTDVVIFNYKENVEFRRSTEILVKDGNGLLVYKIPVSQIDKMVARRIYYKTTDGKAIKFTPEEMTASGILTNEYVDGQGVLTFDKDLTEVPKMLFMWQHTLSDVVLPDQIKEIGPEAFSSCSALDKVKLPEGLERLAYFAFRDCSSLQEIEIPQGVEVLESCSFADCSSLSKVVLHEGIKKISNQVFRDCANLSSINLPSTLTEFEYSGFSGCSSLESISIPEGVLSIPASLFYGCKRLKSIVLPSKLKTIESNAFSGCTDLETINLPESLETIGCHIFQDCTSLTAITSPYVTDDRSFYIKDNVLMACFNDAASEISIPSGLVEIPDRIFDTCRNLTRVILPDGLLKIGNYSFYQCKGLTDVNIPSTVTSIGEYAFFGCAALKSVILPDSLQKLGVQAFGKCSPELKVTSKYLTSDLNYFIKDGVLSQCFNSNLTEAVIPQGVTHVSDFAFDGMETLSKVTFPSSLISIGWGAFAGTGLTDLTIPSHIRELRQAAFADCPNLVSVELSSTVDTLARYLFHNCNRLKSVLIPEGITGIGKEAFSSCGSLEEITIPSSVTKCDEETFMNDGHLSKVTFSPGSKLEVMPWYMFYNCTQLQSITIPSSVREIGYCVFEWCRNLKQVVFNEGLKLIGENAFKGTALESMALPNSLMAYGIGNLHSPSQLQSKYMTPDQKFIIKDNRLITSFESGEQTLYIPDGIHTISYESVAPLHISTLVVPVSVTEIELFGCYNAELKKIYFKSATVPDMKEDILANTQIEKIYVPLEAVGAYKASPGLSKYVDKIVGFDFTQPIE